MRTVSPIVDVDRKDLEGLLERAQLHLSPEDAVLLGRLVGTLEQVLEIARARGSNLARLRRLFGISRSEKTRDVVGSPDTTGTAQPAAAPGAGPATPSTPT